MKLPLTVFSSLLLTMAAVAGPVSVDTKGVALQQDIWSRFDKGNIEIQGLTGAYFSFDDEGTTLNQSMSAYRLGIMLNDVSGSGFFRGNSELLLDISGGKIFNGPGDYILGGGLQLRYNFVQPDSRWVPYVQVGAGAVYNNVYEEDQPLIGKSVEGSFQGALGVRYLIGDKWSIAIEGGYRFITNFGTDDRHDHGFHSAGAQIGLTRFF